MLKKSTEEGWPTGQRAMGARSLYEFSLSDYHSFLVTTDNGIAITPTALCVTCVSVVLSAQAASQICRGIHDNAQQA